MKGTQFQTEDIKAAKTAELNSIPKEAFSAWFQQWRHRWEKYVESQGNYFEGDEVSNAPGKPVSFSRPKVGYFSNRPRSSSERECD
jgi:hypothetical protein